MHSQMEEEQSGHLRVMNRRWFNPKSPDEKRESCQTVAVAVGPPAARRGEKEEAELEGAAVHLGPAPA